MNIIDLDKKLETFSNLIQELGTGNFTGKELWQRQKEIAENFKAAQFETTELKEAAQQKFQQLINQLKEKENQLEAVNEKFCEEAELLIVQMEQLFAEHSDETPLSKDDFAELRKLSNQAFEYFKLPRWSTKDRRTTAWDKYSNIRNAVKDKEDELYTKAREEKTKQISQSLEITEKLCVVVNACHPSVDINELLSFANRFHQFLQEGNLTELNTPWHLIEKPEDVKYSLRCRTETLNDVRTFINNYRDYLTREHKGQIFENIDALKLDLNKAWETHKEDQQKRQEEWEVKKRERDEKRIEWNKKQQDFLKMLEGRLENQIAYKSKQESYLQSQKEYAARFENRIPQQQDYIKKLVEQVIDLEKKYATAWTDSFKTKVEEWITEKKEKIASVEEDIEVLKGKIADINKKAEELPNKIKELDDSIGEIKSKIEEVKEKLQNDTLIGNTNVESREEMLKENKAEVDN
jgi:prefoldin subunit 5